MSTLSDRVTVAIDGVAVETSRERVADLDPRRTPYADVPPADWRDHPEGFEDGYDEEWDGEPDAGGYPDEEGW